MILVADTGNKWSKQILNEWMNEWRVVDERTTGVPSYNIFQRVNSKLGRQHTKAPLAATLSPFMSLLYPPSPRCEWCDVWRLTTTPGSTSPSLSEQWCGFFYVPQEPDKCKCCKTRPTVFSSLSEKTRKSNHLEMSLQRQHFLLSHLKTLSVGPAGVRTRDLPLSRPPLSQLSKPGGGFSFA